MGTEQNLQTIMTVYEAFGRGDVDTILAHVTDDVDWAAEAEGDAAPWYGTRTGKDEAAQFFTDIAGAIDVLEFAPTSFGTSDDEVFVLIRFSARVKATGNTYAMNLHHYWHFRDGKIDRYRGSEDSAQTLAAFSGSRSRAQTAASV